MRSIDELVSVPDPAWPEVERLARAGGARILDAEPECGRRCLLALQVTAHSFLGALALNCGGIVTGDGWFRLYGAGCADLPGLDEVNGLHRDDHPTGRLEVGVDVLGGRFAIDGGGLGIGAGEVCYFGPDTLEWEGLGSGHSAFVCAVLDGGLGSAFDALRWPGWEEEIEALPAGAGLSVYPPLFSVEGAGPAGATRSPVPLTGLAEFYADAAERLRGSG